MAAAAAAAAASSGGATAVAAQGKSAKKEKRADVDRSLPFKKRCKMVIVDHAAATAAKATPAVAAPTKDQDHVASDNFTATATSLQSKDAPPPAMPFHAFPADEITDAAMLLMTLSCGLVRS
uniref:Uncharacterized protein n=1 Tax=Arundo donax TaxID=35708 RepID=A0A0A9H980_ARUDO